MFPLSPGRMGLSGGGRLPSQVPVHWQRGRRRNNEPGGILPSQGMTYPPAGQPKRPRGKVHLPHAPRGTRHTQRRRDAPCEPDESRNIRRPSPGGAGEAPPPDGFSAKPGPGGPCPMSHPISHPPKRRTAASLRETLRFAFSKASRPARPIGTQTGPPR